MGVPVPGFLFVAIDSSCPDNTEKVARFCNELFLGGDVEIDLLDV